MAFIWHIYKLCMAFHQGNQGSITAKCIISDMTRNEKLLRLLINFSKLSGALCFLYLFVCSLDLLALAFRLVAGRTASTFILNMLH